MKKLFSPLCIVAFCAVALVLPEAARAAVWVGGNSGLWSDNANWTSSTPPAAGAVVTFNASTTGSAANMIMNNNIITSIGVITVGSVPGGANAKPITIGGNSLTLATSGNNVVLQSGSTDDLTFDLTPGNTITLAGAANNWIVNQPRTLTIKSPIVGTSASTLNLSGPAGVAGGVHGTVQLLAASPNLASPVTIGGPNMFVVIGDDQAFGTGNVFVNSLNTAPQLVTTANRTLSNSMTWGSGFGLDATSVGDLTLNGPITLVGAAANRTINNVSATKTVFVNGDVVTSQSGDTGIRTFTLQTNPGNIVVNGKISDANSLVGAMLKTQAGTATINSTNSTFAGQVTIQNGVVEVTKLADQGTASSLGSGATTPSLQLGAATNTGTLRYIGTTNSSTNRPIHLSGSTGGATLDSSGVGTMSFTSATMVTPNSVAKTLTFTGSNTGDNSFASAIINGPNATSVSKTGDGKWILTGNSSYSGGTTVSAGTLLANNTTGSATGTGTISVGSGATFGGTGAVSGAVTVNSGGTVSPGASIESLGASGGVTFNAGSTFKYEINSTLIAADLLNALGGSVVLDTTGAGVALNTSDLNPSSPVLADGTKFTMIAYNGNANIGTFAGVADLSLVSIGAKQFRIRYKDTNPGGNFASETTPHLASDRFVTLTAVPELGSFITMGLVGCCAVGAVRLGKRYAFNALRL